MFKALADPGRRRAARRAVRRRRPDARRAVRGAAGDDAVRRDEAPRRARAGRARRHPPGRAHQAALPQPGADPRDPRPLDLQVRPARRRGDGRPARRARGTPRPDRPRGATDGRTPSRLPDLHPRHARGRSGRRSPTRRSPTRYFHRTAIESTFAAGAAVRYVLPDGDDAVVGVDRGGRPAPPPGDDVAGAVRRRRSPRSRRAGSSGCSTPGADGVTRVTTIHRDLALSPGTSASVGDGWPWILDSLKSLLETGEPLAGAPPPRTRDGERPRRRRGRVAPHAWPSTPTTRRGSCSAATTCRPTRPTTCSAGPTPRRTTGAGRPRRGPENAARAAWLVSRAHAVLGQGEPPCTTPTGAAAVVGDRRARRLRPRLRPRGAGAGAGLPRPARRGRRPSWPPPAPCRSPTTRTARSSTATSPPALVRPRRHAAA